MAIRVAVLLFAVYAAVHSCKSGVYSPQECSDLKKDIREIHLKDIDIEYYIKDLVLTYKNNSCCIISGHVAFEKLAEELGRFSNNSIGRRVALRGIEYQHMGIFDLFNYSTSKIRNLSKDDLHQVDKLLDIMEDEELRNRSDMMLTENLYAVFKTIIMYEIGKVPDRKSMEKYLWEFITDKKFIRLLHYIKEIEDTYPPNKKQRKRQPVCGTCVCGLDGHHEKRRYLKKNKIHFM